MFPHSPGAVQNLTGCTRVSIFSCIGMAGYIILIASRNATLSYIGVYLAACGIYPNIPNTIAWVSNNVEGSYKRSVTLASAKRGGKRCQKSCTFSNCTTSWVI